MAALTVARLGSPVLVIEGTKDGGKKILISGGGRCNVLPSVAAPERFVTDSSSNTLSKVLRSWPLAEQQRFFEDTLGIPLAKEEGTGKLFPRSNRARDVRDTLVRGVLEAGGRIWFETRAKALLPAKQSQDLDPSSATKWMVVLDNGETIPTSAVIMATGGLSVPATGSDGSGLAILRRLGHRIHPTYPALTPLTADPHLHAHLAGISLEVTITAPGARPRFGTTGGFLITHRGYSGPTVLDASHLAIRSRSDHRQALRVGWTSRDRHAWERDLLAGKGTAGSVVERALPSRLARQLLDEAGVPADRPLAQLQKGERKSLLTVLTDYDLPWTGDEGYKKAEVTGGGIALDEVDPRTLESKHCPGLFLCGELLDAFGPIGGHNFSWAWSTGRAAGQAAATCS